MSSVDVDLVEKIGRAIKELPAGPQRRDFANTLGALLAPTCLGFSWIKWAEWAGTQEGGAGLIGDPTPGTQDMYVLVNEYEEWYRVAHNIGGAEQYLKEHALEYGYDETDLAIYKGKALTFTYPTEGEIADY